MKTIVRGILWGKPMSSSGPLLADDDDKKYKNMARQMNATKYTFYLFNTAKC